MQKEWKLSTPGMFVHEVGGATDGEQSEDLGAGLVLPGLGYAERVRDGRCVLAHVGVAEPYAHGDGRHRLGVRPRGAGAPGRDPLTLIRRGSRSAMDDPPSESSR